MDGLAHAFESEDPLDAIESYDEGTYIDGEDLDELAEMRRRRARRGQGQINPGRTGTGRDLFQPRPNLSFVTQAQLKAGLDRVGRQIAANSQSIQKVAAQASSFSRELGRATTRLEAQMGTLKKEVQRQAETGLLLGLLQKAPELVTANTDASTNTAGEVVTNVKVKQPSNLLPLLLLTSSGGLGGGDSKNMLFLALALSGQI